MSDSEDPPSVEKKRAKLKSVGFVDPLYAEQPKIIWDKMYQIKSATFVEKYGFWNEGISPSP